MVPLLIIPVLAPSCTGQRIRVLLTGQIDPTVNPLQAWFLSEPLVDFLPVPSRDLRGDLGGDEAMKKYVRLYFPRTKEAVLSYDFFLMNSPILVFFRADHIRWLHDAIFAGSGGLNTASIMSQDASIHGAWVQSVLQEAFPNDAPAVVERFGGATSSISAFRAVVNREFPEPVLTPFLPFGIEKYVGYDSRVIIPREGSTAMAWQVGNFPLLKDVPFILVWQYGKGRTVTTGDAFGHTFWSSFRARPTDNEYPLDILMNIIFYSTHRQVQTEILVFHRMRLSFLEFRDRLAILLVLADFVEKFGASSVALHRMIRDLESLVAEAGEAYVSQDFKECNSIMESAFEGIKLAEAEAMELRRRGLLMVYMVEWMVTCSTLMISMFCVWTVMVRRRLYKQVGVTRSA